MNFKNAVLSGVGDFDHKTTNGMDSYSTSENAVLDLFYQIGASREMGEPQILSLFTAAWAQNPLNAMKVLFYARDIRGGLMERRVFRTIFKFLCENYPEVAIKNLKNVLEFGRADDLFVAFNTPVEPYMAEFVLAQLQLGNNLMYKWMPREGKKFNDYALGFMEYFGLTPRQYRLALKSGASTTETSMCKKLWGEINYSHVPGTAMRKYRKAFSKHDADRFGAYLESLKNGDKGVKINASTVFIHDLVGTYLAQSGERELDSRTRFVEDATVEAMWAAQKDYVGDEFGDTLCVPDLSGSMFDNGGLPAKVSLAMAFYFARFNKGPFKGLACSFSSSPSFILLDKPTIKENLDLIKRTPVGYSTDIQATFRAILNKAKAFNLSQEDMPKNLLIVSDMGFDQCDSRFGRGVIELAQNMFRSEGYEAPKLVLWNVEGSSNGVPMKADQSGAMLVSGFSTSIFQTIISGNPLKAVLDNPRYDVVVCK